MINPFFTSGAIAERRHFVGRDRNLRQIQERVFNATPTSVNLVGESRSGKSSLLRHVCRIYESVADPQQFVTVYVDFGRSRCQTETDFYATIAAALTNEIPRKRSGFWERFQRDTLEKPLMTEPFDRVAFDRAMTTWHNVGVRPVLCLDQFEYLLEHPDRFPNAFYDGLRALADEGIIALAIASRQTIERYGQNQTQYTSQFFNLFHTLPVGDLEDAAAWDLVRLPSSSDPALTEANQAIARKWGGCDALRLQAAGWCLFEMQRDGVSLKQARRQFESMTARRPKGWRDWRNWLRFVGWNVPVFLGQLIPFVGQKRKEVVSWIGGVILLLAMVGAVGGTLQLELLDQLAKWIKAPIPEQSEKDST